MLLERVGWIICALHEQNCWSLDERLIGSRENKHNDSIAQHYLSILSPRPIRNLECVRSYSSTYSLIA